MMNANTYVLNATHEESILVQSIFDASLFEVHDFCDKSIRSTDTFHNRSEMRFSEDLLHDKWKLVSSTDIKGHRTYISSSFSDRAWLKQHRTELLLAAKMLNLKSFKVGYITVLITTIEEDRPHYRFGDNFQSNYYDRREEFNQKEQEARNRRHEQQNKEQVEALLITGALAVISVVVLGIVKLCTSKS